MLTGAVASSHYGKPRTTMDIDLVVRVPQKEIPRLLSSIKKAGLEVHPEKAKTSLKAGYNILTFKDTKTSNSVDIILTKKTLRRRRGSLLGLPTYYQSPEDLILAKLRMIKATMNPERALTDRQDIKAIIQFTQVNIQSVKKQAKKESTIETLISLLS